ncbi:MAG TPA: hypothetical protein VK817_24160 [Trebonia sp.]|jgi:hypothetical protein|nr:hypothetical protein [Trebonia sp.]
MEVILGFAVGYWVGTRNGRDGLDKAIDSARAIWASPETRRLLAEGVSALEAAAPVITRMQQNRGGRPGIIRDVVADIVERRHEQRARAA